MMNEKKLQELIDKDEITEKILRWARGCDRAELEAMASAYHEDAMDRHASLYKTGQDMSKFLEEWSLAMPVVNHHISNILIDLYGDVALAETYVLATTTDEKKVVNVLGGRYLDRFERRGGEWKIADRKSVVDWGFQVPETFGFDEEFIQFIGPRGGKMPSDELYELLNSSTR